MKKRMRVYFEEEVSFVPVTWIINQKPATKEFGAQAFTKTREHIEKQRPGGLSLMALAIRGEPLTQDEQIKLAEEQGRRRLVLKAQVRLCLQNQENGATR
jgi:hypothetical protein